MDFVRNIKATATTVRLIALLKITASSVGILKLPISTGRRNSAPPRPIKPPKAPINEPDKKPFPFRFDSEDMAFPFSLCHFRHNEKGNIKNKGTGSTYLSPCMNENKRWD